MCNLIINICCFIRYIICINASFIFKVLLSGVLFFAFTVPSYATSNEVKVLFLYSYDVLNSADDNPTIIKRKSQEWIDRTNAIYRRQDIPIRLSIATNRANNQGVMPLTHFYEQHPYISDDDGDGTRPFNIAELLGLLISSEFNAYFSYPTGFALRTHFSIQWTTCHIFGISYPCIGRVSTPHLVATGYKQISIGPRALISRSLNLTSQQKEQYLSLLTIFNRVRQWREDYNADFVVMFKGGDPLNNVAGIGAIGSPDIFHDYVDSICESLLSGEFTGGVSINCDANFRSVITSLGGVSRTEYDNVGGTFLELGDVPSGTFHRHSRRSRHIQFREVLANFFTEILPYYSAYSIIDYNSEDVKLLAHELGHNMGLSHSHKQTREVAEGDIISKLNNAEGFSDYAYGYGEEGDFYTLMAYRQAFSTNISEEIFREDFERGTLISTNKWDWDTTDSSSPTIDEHRDTLNYREHFRYFMPSFGPFWLTRGFLRATADQIGLADTACKQDYGNSFRVADWEDIARWFQGGSDGDTAFNHFAVHLRSTPDFGAALITYQGREIYSGFRHYYVHYPVHISSGFNNPPGSILSNGFRLGAWSVSVYALCYDENYHHFDGFHNNNAIASSGLDLEPNNVLNPQRFADYHLPRNIDSKHMLVHKRAMRRNDFNHHIRILSKESFDIDNTELSFYARLPQDRLKTMMIGWIDADTTLSLSSRELPEIAFHARQVVFPGSVLEQRIFYRRNTFSRLADMPLSDGIFWHYYQIKIYDNKALFFMDHKLIAVHNLHRNDLNSRKKIGILSRAGYLQVDNIEVHRLSAISHGRVRSLNVFSDPNRYCRGNKNIQKPCGVESSTLTESRVHANEAPADAARLLRENAERYSNYRR